ncbi:MAG: glycosyltransferase family 2 protein [Armatimonadota bacterium]
MISVIVLNWNGKEYLARCFDSLRNQSFRDFEVYMIDNGSYDGSVDFVRKNYPEIKIITLKENVGFARGVNKGIKSSAGEFIALLNNDTEVESKWLEELYSGIREDSKIGICASKMLFYYKKDIINAAGDMYRADGVPDNIGIGEKDVGQYNEKRFVFGACAGAALYRRAMFEDIGLFDEDYFEAVEDADLSFRAQLRGYKCLYNPKAVVYHVHMGTAEKFKELRFENTLLNRLRTLIKNMPLSVFGGNFFWIFLTHLAEFFAVMLNPIKSFKMKKAYFKAYFKIIKEIPRLLKKRKQVQKDKRVSDRYISSILAPMSFSYYFNLFEKFTKRA